MAKKSSRYDKDGLTTKQAAFALEYIKDYNALRAAIRAGYSEKAAHVTAHRLLSNAKVSRVIDRNLEKSRGRVKIDADYVLQRFAQIDQMKIGDIVKNGKVMPIEEWPDIWQEMVVGQIDQVPTGDDVASLVLFLSKLKFPDKIRNLEMMGKHVGVKAFAADITRVEHGLTDDAARTIKDVLRAMDGKSTGIRQPSPPQIEE